MVDKAALKAAIRAKREADAKAAASDGAVNVLGKRVPYSAFALGAVVAGLGLWWFLKRKRG